jgi:hypothetical protein
MKQAEEMMQILEAFELPTRRLHGLRGQTRRSTCPSEYALRLLAILDKRAVG